jgi:LuxR family transcriptional regulator, maltose regulon positive regulatory protein
VICLAEDNPVGALGAAAAETAHAAPLADILDVIHGSPLTFEEHPAPPAQELSPGELSVLRHLPT